MTHTKIKNMLIDFKEANGDGFEVINANSSDQEISLGSQWIEEYDLLASVGSDFHGWPNQRVQIGNLADLPNTSRAIWSHL
jgi:predicted metal-dependent phosphoesterase TrpH